MPLQLDYYYGNEAEQYSFYRIPKVLFTDSRFKGLSVEAKVLYGLLLDRMALSVRNNWLDQDGRVYIIYTIADVMETPDRNKTPTEKEWRSPLPFKWIALLRGLWLEAVTPV